MSPSVCSYGFNGNLGGTPGLGNCGTTQTTPCQPRVSLPLITSGLLKLLFNSTVLIVMLGAFWLNFSKRLIINYYKLQLQGMQPIPNIQTEGQRNKESMLSANCRMWRVFSGCNVYQFYLSMNKLLLLKGVCRV